METPHQAGIRRLAASVAALLALSACSGTAASTGRAEQTPPAATRPPSSAPATAWPAAVAVDHTVIGVGFGPHRISLADGDVWTASLSGAVNRLAPQETQSHLVVDSGVGLAAVAVNGRRLFLGDNGGSRVLVHDKRTGRPERTIRMPGPVRGVLSAFGSVWVTAGSSVVRIDPSSLRRQSATEVGGEAAQMAVSGEMVVVSNRATEQVSALDRSGKAVGTVAVGGPSIGLVVTDQQIWVLRTDVPEAEVISRERFAPAGSVQLPGIGYDAAQVGDEVWVTVADLGTVARLTPAGLPIGQLTVGRRPLGIAAAADTVWVANEGESNLWRLPASPATVDP